MKTNGKKRGFALKVFLAGLVTFALALGSCLNPISFNPDELPTFKVVGEISVDNINSAELNFRNHTRSVDIIKVDVMQYRAETSYSEESGGSTLTDVTRLDARISGSPTAGTQDTVLVRPTGTNVTNTITVKGYTIKIWYRKAQNFPADLEGKFTDLQNAEATPLEVTLNELPRGRCVFHVYRNKEGNIAIDVEGTTNDPDYGDHYFDSDFIMDVKSQTNIDLTGLELAVSLPPITIGGQPVEISFSDELLTAVNTAFSGLGASMDKVATSISDLALSIESSRLFGKDTGMLVVMNWAPKKVEVQVPSGSHTYVIGPVSTGDLDGMLLSTNGGSKYNLKVVSEDSVIQTKNTFVFNQKVSYLHVYVDKGGSVVSDVTESPDRPADAKLGYGRLRLKNYTGYDITNIMFKKKVGIGDNAVYDDSKSFIVQRVGVGSEYQPSSVASDRVEEGNYSVFCTLQDGSVVFDGLDFYILPDDLAYQTGDNVIAIQPGQIKPPSSTIMYTVVADGGPPASTGWDSYSTTKLVVTFSSPVSGGISLNRTAMTSKAGTALSIDSNSLVYEIPVTDPETEVAKFKLIGTNVDPSEHQVQIYKKESGGVSFVPVTDVIVLNNERFTKGTKKTIQWKVIPEDATKQDVLWTLGEADLIIFLGAEHYGMGADGKQYSDPAGQFIVSTGWNNNYLDLAVIVKNGKAPGTRNPTINSVGETIIDADGNTASVTILALYFDKDKDFVKLFRFISPDTTPPPLPPPSPPPSTTNVVLNYIGRGAGGKDQWSVNLIEVYKRPTALYKSKYGNAAINNDNRLEQGPKYDDVTDKGGGVLTHGNPLTGKTGVHWQANPMDEIDYYWGGTSEGWIDGSKKPNGDAFDNNNQNALQFLPYPAVPGTEKLAIAEVDRLNMAFAYWGDGTHYGPPTDYNTWVGGGGYYDQYRLNFRGETRTNFIGSLLLSGAPNGHENGLVGALRDKNGDGKLNATGEQYTIALPTNQGKLWLRLRMDYNDGTVGYWWKAVYLQEWFVFDPSQNYAKDANGNVIIDVDLYATPYMTYRK